jgi:hypothetical protein
MTWKVGAVNVGGMNPHDFSTLKHRKSWLHLPFMVVNPEHSVSKSGNMGFNIGILPHFMYDHCQS